MNLSDSIAKLARADKHLDELKRETPRLIKEGTTNAATFGEIDQDSGWCSVFIEPIDQEKVKPLGVIMGDFVHNLRCGLDYIVSQLAGDSLIPRHQFPVFHNRDDYLAKVGTDTKALSGGCLNGITRGLREIWDLQPFHRGKDAVFDALYSLNRFSNADKHRIISTARMIPSGPGEASIDCNGTIIETHGEVADLSTWRPDKNFEVSRIRFARPYPTKYHIKGEVAVEILFLTPAFDIYPRGELISINALGRLHEHVSRIVDTFKNL